MPEKWAAVAFADPRDSRAVHLSVEPSSVRVASTGAVTAAAVFLFLAGGLPSRAQVVSPDGQGACPEGFLAIGEACVNPTSPPGWTYPKPADLDCLPEWMDIPANDECLRI